MSDPHTAAPRKLNVPSVFSGKAWQQVLTRDAQADGQFVYAVKTTKIFCRPSCPSRRPERKNVSFFPSPQLAEAAGFRPCLLCDPAAAAPRPDPQSAAIEAVTGYLTEHSGERTRLKDVAAATGVAPLTILRGFKRVLGVSPAEFAKAQRAERSKRRVRAPGATTAGADAQVSGAGDTGSPVPESPVPAITSSAMKPGGLGETIRYTVAESPLGPMLVGATARGICAICFGADEAALLDELRGRYPKAATKRMDAELSYAVDEVLASLSGSPRPPALAFDVRATDFQLRVWRALAAIPHGETRSYTQIAAGLGQPGSARAVGQAVGANPLAVAIPCHRVVGSSGRLTGWRWGTGRKQALLALEGAGARPELSFADIEESTASVPDHG